MKIEKLLVINVGQYIHPGFEKNKIFTIYQRNKQE